MLILESPKEIPANTLWWFRGGLTCPSSILLIFKIPSSIKILTLIFLLTIKDNLFRPFLLGRPLVWVRVKFKLYEIVFKKIICFYMPWHNAMLKYLPRYVLLFVLDLTVRISYMSLASITKRVRRSRTYVTNSSEIIWNPATITSQWFHIHCSYFFFSVIISYDNMLHTPDTIPVVFQSPDTGFLW